MLPSLMEDPSCVHRFPTKPLYATGCESTTRTPTPAHQPERSSGTSLLFSGV